MKYIKSLDAWIDPVSFLIYPDKRKKGEAYTIKDVDNKNIISFSNDDIKLFRKLLRQGKRRIYKLQAAVDIYEDHISQDLTKFKMSKVPTKKKRKKSTITNDNIKEFYDLVKKEIRKGAKEISFNGNKMSIDKAKLILQHFNNKGII